MYVCLLFGTTTVAMSIGENAQGAIPIRPYFLSVGLRLSDPITNLTQRADLTQRRRDSQRAAESSFLCVSPRSLRLCVKSGLALVAAPLAGGEGLTQRRGDSQRAAESSFSLRGSAFLCVSALSLVWH